MKSKVHRIAGFTLMELLVVIAIIALLLSILMPSLNKARELARRTVCGSNLRQLHLGLVLYAEAYGVYPAARLDAPFMYGDVSYTYPPGAPGTPQGLSHIAPFLSIRSMGTAQAKRYFLCPSAHKDWKDLGPANSDFPYWFFTWIDHSTVTTPYDIKKIVGKPASPSNLLLLTDLTITSKFPNFLVVEHGINHAARGDLVGANQLYNDGHVEWQAKTKMTMHRYKPTSAIAYWLYW